MDWSQSGRQDRFEFARVTLQGREVEILDNVVGGQISENLNTSLKASGVLQAVGGLDIGNDLVRVYLVTGDERIALGTFFVATPVASIGDGVVTVDAECYSTLLVLDEDALETMMSIPAGTNAVAAARAFAESTGLTVFTGESSATTTTSAVYKPGTTLLEVVNDLLDFAGFAAAQVDGYGRVIMRPATDPLSQSPVWTFRDDEASIMLPEMEDELDWYHTPNVVVLTMSNDAGDMVAVARNDDPASPLSIASRGRRIVRMEDVDDTPNQAALQAKADLLLTTSSQLLQRITLSHSYAPIALGDVIAVEYGAAGIEYVLTVRTRELTLTEGVPTTTEARRFVR